MRSWFINYESVLGFNTLELTNCLQQQFRHFVTLNTSLSMHQSAFKDACHEKIVSAFASLNRSFIVELTKNNISRLVLRLHNDFEKRFDWSGIRTHAPEEIGALIQRLRPLGHPVLISSIPELNSYKLYICSILLWNHMFCPDKIFW